MEGLPDGTPPAGSMDTAPMGSGSEASEDENEHVKRVLIIMLVCKLFVRAA